MPSSKTLCPHTVKAVFGLHKEGRSSALISELFGRKKSWASSLMLRYDAETGLPLKSGKKGRPRKTDQTQDEIIRRLALSLPLKNSKQIHSVLMENNFGNVSRKTIRRRVQEIRKNQKKAVLKKKKLINEASQQSDAT